MEIMLQRILELIPKVHGAKKELCDFLGIKSNTISEWVSGRNKSYSKYAPQIAEFYNVSLDWLCGLSDEKEKPDTQADAGLSGIDLENFKKFQQLSDSAQSAILALIDTMLKNQQE